MISLSEAVVYQEFKTFGLLRYEVRVLKPAAMPGRSIHVDRDSDPERPVINISAAAMAIDVIETYRAVARYETPPIALPPADHWIQSVD